jgi:single-strand DNA-binding protein
MVDNTVTIVGNLTADPEVRVTDSGATLAEIRIAQNKRKRNSDGSWEEGEPMYFQGTVWNDMAENAASSLQKGMRVIVTGRLNYRSWENQEGQNRSVVDIAIDEVAPSLRWARANIERTSSGGSASGTDAPKARDDFEENEAPLRNIYGTAKKNIKI